MGKRSRCSSGAPTRTVLGSGNTVGEGRPVEDGWMKGDDLQTRDELAISWQGARLMNAALPVKRPACWEPDSQF